MGGRSDLLGPHVHQLHTEGRVLVARWSSGRATRAVAGVVRRRGSALRRGASWTVRTCDQCARSALGGACHTCPPPRTARAVPHARDRGWLSAALLDPRCRAGERRLPPRRPEGCAMADPRQGLSEFREQGLRRRRSEATSSARWSSTMMTSSSMSTTPSRSTRS